MSNCSLAPRSLSPLSLGLLFMVAATTAIAQTTGFTYQGKLTDSGNLANGNYDLQFKLFDAVSGGAQQGTTQTVNSVAVTNGIFTVQLDFGVCASCFNGSARFLEIAVRSTSGGSFTTLSPRQPVTSTPYAINSSQLGGLAASGFLQNSTTQQTSSNFNISGNGTAGGTLTGSIVNATTQVNINGLRAFTVNGAYNDGAGTVFTATNTFMGDGAGVNTTPDPDLTSLSGKFNSFYGAGAGQANTVGGNNAFFGTRAGLTNTGGFGNAFFGPQTGFSNTTGGGNAFFGTSAGFSNTIGSGNAFFGTQAGQFNTTGNNNSFFGYQSGQQNTTASNNSFFGYLAGNANTTGNNNSFFGYQNGLQNTTGFQNAFFGTQAGQANTDGFNNAFFGWQAGLVNTSGHSNTFIGYHADFNVTNPTGDNNTLLGFGTLVTSGVSNGTAIGANAAVTQSNTLILGGISGVNNGTSVNVGIGTSAPQDRLHVFGDIRVGTSGTNGCLKNNNGGTIVGTCSSDARFKRDITPFPNLLSQIVQLRPVYFYWRSEQFPDRHFGQAQEAGLIAQEVEKVLPELVVDDEQGYKAVNYSKLPLLSIQAIKELKQENDQLKQHLTEQQKEIVTLKKKVEQVEALKRLVCKSNPDEEMCKP